ncbi:SDR family NAD(P)-dependent oxidoreductase [Pseudonocardia sediminis]|uniref:SDR family NAD(P)-dependent oxidoreductase n=1 Tax=Pseudonocardia sediminis TaxID=1397368 RepID=UPI001F5E7BE8|nr:SDR family oxidoreductase [Pseudonocardia sediminis]
MTGGATGIGHAITRRLAADGAAVVVAGLGKKEVDVVVAALLDDGRRAAGFAGDLAEPGTADRLCDEALAAFDAVDVLVNNAGGGVIRPTLEHTEDTLRATIDNNLWTTLRCSLAVLPHMRRRGYGRIVNIGAESVRNGLTDHAVYNAAKGGVHALATGLAREFAGDGITVNTVAPSYIRTDALDAAMAAGRVPGRLRTVVDDAVALIPLGRPGEVDEVAAAVAYLAREDSRFVTGQTLSVNGGSSMS